jgi:hypothetical protein
MLANRRYRLAGLIAAIALSLTAGPAAHYSAESGHQARPAIAGGPICPAGTNWNNTLHACI